VTVVTPPPDQAVETAPAPRRRRFETVWRVARYAVARALGLALVVIVAVYITILITNKAVVLQRDMDPNPSPIQGWFAGIANVSVASSAFNNSFRQMSFFDQSLALLVNGVTFRLENTYVRYLGPQRTLSTTRAVILDALPRTLLVFGIANVLLFFSSVSLALFLSRRPASALNRWMLALGPLSVAPAWLYGVLLIIFRAKVLRLFPGGLWDAWPDEFSWSYVWFVAQHVTPAVLAIFLSKFFQSVLAWRSFLLIHAGEDYVELARAKGLPPGLVERRYLLRPVLPSILTSLALLLVGIWQEAIILELFFGVSGIGHLFFNAIRYRDMALMVSLTVIFAYLLAITVFILDIAYALVDPRVKVGADGRLGRVAAARRGRLPRFTRRTRPPGPALAPRSASWRAGLAGLVRSLAHAPAAAGRVLSAGARGLVRHPPALIGALVVLLLAAASLYTLWAVPYAEAVRRWNHDSATWVNNPRNAMPEWTNLFRRRALPRTYLFDSESPGAAKQVEALSADVKQIVIAFELDYPYEGFPNSVGLKVDPTFAAKLPFVSVAWLTPDGREINLGDYILNTSRTFDLAGGERSLDRFLAGRKPELALFQDPAAEDTALPGRYELRLTGLVFEAEGDLDAEFRLFGQVHGLAGTDHLRRDILVALLWGAPIALAIGVLGALGTALLTLLFAAAGAWFGGRLDGLIQRLTEVNLILPVFPILLVIYNFYSKSMWVLLGVVILLGVFGASLKTYRAVFLQVMQMPYVEAARTYGASDWRIVFRYLIPRILPVVVPQVVLTIPSYVFLEATLAYLLMSDPLLPTWGKLIQAGFASGGLDSAPHTVLLPVGVLLLTSVGFLLLGYSLERALNPRLRAS
jgi:peptide/nickel transport system permease protein